MMMWNGRLLYIGSGEKHEEVMSNVARRYSSFLVLSSLRDVEIGCVSNTQSPNWLCSRRRGPRCSWIPFTPEKRSSTAIA